jgi:SAM-dependent methyltransferase
VLDRGYDFVTAQDVLEHVDDPAAFIASMKRYVAPGGCVVIGTPNADAIDLHHRLDQVGPLHQPYHRHIAAASELQRLVADGSWQVVEFNKDWYVDTRVPFVNSAFLFRYFESGGGFMDVGFDPVSPLHMLKYPGLFSGASSVTSSHGKPTWWWSPGPPPSAEFSDRRFANP